MVAFTQIQRFFLHDLSSGSCIKIFHFYWWWSNFFQKDGSKFSFPNFSGTFNILYQWRINIYLLLDIWLCPPWRTSLAFLILPFSFSDAFHISKYFSLIAISTLTLFWRHLFSSCKSLISETNPALTCFLCSLFLLLRDNRCLLLLSNGRLHFLFLKTLGYK